MAVINLTTSNTLEDFRVASNTVFGRVGDLTTLTSQASVVYTGLVGINANDFVGTPGQFTVTRALGNYTAVITTAGTTYEVGDTILIKGSLLGGVDTTNDCTITVATIDGAGVGAVLSVTVAGTPISDVISEVNALRVEMGTLINDSLDTTAQTFYAAVNEHEADIGQVSTLTTTATNLTGAVNELDAFQGNTSLTTTAQTISAAVVELDTLQGNVALTTTANTITGAIAEHEADIGTVSTLGTGSKIVVGAINEIETAVRGTLSNYTLNTTANNLVGAINEHESDLGTMSFTAQGTSADHAVTVGYVNLGSTVTSGLNALKAKTDFLADEIGGEMSADYVGTDNNVITALNNLYAASSISTLNDIYLRRDTQDWVTTGTFRVGAEGIGGGIGYNGSAYTYSDFKIKAYDSANALQDRIIIKQGSGNIGINKVPGTYKVDVNGSLNGSSGLYWDGQSTDARYLRTGGTTQTVATTTNFSGTLQYKGEEADTRFMRINKGSAQEVTTPTVFNGSVTFNDPVIIGSTTVASDSLTITEWVEDVIGSMITGNTEIGGISAVYDDGTGKITLAIANNAHNHISTNISDFDEAVQDVIGAMVGGNTESGITVTYQDVDGTLDFDVNDPVITIAGEASGSATMTNLGNTTISVTLSDEAIQDRMHYILVNGDHTGIAAAYDDAGNKINLSLTADPVLTLSGDATGSATFSNLTSTTLSVAVVDDSHFHASTTISDWTEAVQDTVGAMVNPTNTEAGISVTYDDTSGKLNFDVNDPTLTFSGDVTGSGTMTNLASLNISLAVVNDSHTHDTRYYTETESDGRYVYKSGDTISGALTVTGLLTVGANNAGNSVIDFYDDNDNTTRSFFYDQTNWYVEDNGGTNRILIHAGNVASYTVTNATNAVNSTNSTYSDNTYVTRDDSTNTTYYPIFAPIGSAQHRMRNDAGLNYNPGLNILTTGTFAGMATTARYADVAEKYLADMEYEPGTVIAVGGVAEVTAADHVTAFSVIGVVSENPAIMMNSGLEGGTYIALKGRVPVKINGPVQKGDRLAASTEKGVAMVNNDRNAWSFAIALSDSDGDMVEAVIL